MAKISFAFKLQTLVVLALPFALGACGSTDRIKASSEVPMDDYRIRHPIVISEAPTAIDVFPSLAQGRLDSHTAKQVYAFAQQYRDTGHGRMLVLLPRGRVEGDHRVALAGIRHVLEAAGVRSDLDVSTYPVADAALASPVRLSFRGVKAQVADECGQWPNDLASGSSIEGWQNKPYWNFGCATQSMMAAQVSDPRDLVTPRGEEPVDTVIRSRSIDSIRKGADPSTSWTVKNNNIGGVGGS